MGIKYVPLPSGVFAIFAEVVHSGHQVAREHSAQDTADMEDTGTLCELIFAIPGADNILDTRIKCAFSEACENY